MLRAFYAADRDRTGTLSPARDFKSLASASSATAAHLQLLYRNRGRLSICVEERRWIWYTDKKSVCISPCREDFVYAENKNGPPCPAFSSGGCAGGRGLSPC